MKKKLSLIISLILILQIALPMFSILFESRMTLISRAEEDNVYYIDTAQELWDFATEVNNGNTFEGVTVYLTQDIDLGCSEDRQWTPIGDDFNDGQKIFKGIFDGQNHSISGIYINSDKAGLGLFGINIGTIKKLTIDGQVSSSNQIVGALVAENVGDIIEVINHVTVKGASGVGGIAGANFGRIIASTNNGEIIETTDNNISIGYYEEYGIGGIVGVNFSKILDCTNNGKVSGDSAIGGIAGIQDNYYYYDDVESYSLIFNCSNYGNVKSTIIDEESFIGGIVGAVGCRDTVVVKDCQNFGLVEGGVMVGGIAGWNYQAIIQDSCNKGEVNGAISSSGIVGLNEGYILRSYNMGNVKATVSQANYDNVTYVTDACGSAGIAMINSGKIESCYNTGKIGATVLDELEVGAYVAGLIAGNAEEGVITNCYTVGKMEATTDTGIIYINRRNCNKLFLFRHQLQ